MRDKGLIAALLLVAPVFSSSAQEATSPLPSEITERVETRILRIDVSVVERRGERRSVPGLRKEMFEVRLGGRALEGEAWDRVAFDEVCRESDGRLPPDLQERHLVVMLDFNYLDGQMRTAAARAVRAMAGEPLPSRHWVKVVGYTRALYTIQDFTRDPDRLEAAARFVETARWPGGLDTDDVVVPGYAPEAGPGAASREGVEAGTDAAFGPSGLPGSPVESEPDDLTSLAESTLSSTVDPSNVFASLGGTEGGNLAALASDFTGLPLDENRPLTEGGAWDPRASLAAIEAVLRGHAGIRGRKALVLFTGESFSLPRQDLERETASVLEAAQGGFSLWIVDARGFFGEGALPAQRSSLITLLANDTGGETLRSSSNLSRVFERARQRLDCYYLLSVPVEAGKEARSYGVSVRLRKKSFDGLGGYTVRHLGRYRLEDETASRERMRVAALLNPDDWDAFPVRADLAFPMENLPMPRSLGVEVSVPLRSLVFRPSPEGGAVAEFLVDAAVDRNGNRTMCLVPDRGEAVVHRIRLREMPRPDFRGHLVVRDLCPYRGRGIYSLRAVVTDPAQSEPGADRAIYYVQPEPGSELVLAALRVGYNTGEDYLLLDPSPGPSDVPRDTARRAFIPLREGDAALTTDRLLFRYVLCGPSRAEAKHRVRRLVYSAGDEAPRSLFTLPDARGETDQEGEGFPLDPFCLGIEDSLPQGTLEPGEYGFAVLLADSEEPLTVARVEEALRTGNGRGLLASVEFRVEAPPDRPARDPEVALLLGP